MNNVDWDNWTTGNFGHEFLFCVISWNLLESSARSLLATIIEANESTQAILEDFQSAHLLNALRLSIGKCRDEDIRARAGHFAKAFELLSASRNTLLHGIVGVHPAADGKGCVGKILTQKVRASHEIVEATLTEAHLRKFILSCQSFSNFGDRIIEELRPDDIRFAFRDALVELGMKEPALKDRKLPPLPEKLNLKRYRIDKMSGLEKQSKD